MVITINLFDKHFSRLMHKAEDHTVHFQRCVVSEEGREFRFSYLIGWQKAQNSLANCVADGKQEGSHLILELEGLCVLEGRTQLPPVGAHSDRADPDLGCSTWRK